MNKKRKILMVAGIVVLAPALALFIAYTVLNVRWGGQLRRELAAMEAAGEPMTTEAVIPRNLPPEDNAAIEYQQIFIAMSDGTFSMQGAGDKAKRWQALEDWTTNTDDRYASLARQCRENPAPLREVIDSDEGKQVFALLARATHKSRIDFKVNYDQGPNALLPHLSYFRTLGRALCVKAQLELLDGHREQAWETVMTGLKMADHLQYEPLLISQLVRLAMHRVLIEFTAYHLPEQGIDREQAARMIQFLAEHRGDHCSAMRRAIQSERLVLGGWLFERMIDGRMNSGDVQHVFGGGKAWHLSLMPVRPFLKKDYAEYLKFMNGYLADYSVPYYQLTENPADKTERRLRELPVFCPFTRMMVPALDRCRTLAAEAIVGDDATRLRLALEIHKSQHGEYPEQLAPEILPQIPVNELTGKPFAYERNEAGYALDSGLPPKP